MTLSSPALEFLEALGLQAELPAPRFFSELARRFVRLLPTETLTHDAARLRGPDEVFSAYVESGHGSAGLERARAFLALAEGLGFDAAPRRGTRDGGGEHEALVATVGGRRLLVDVTYPLPEPLLVGAGEVASPYGALRAAESGEEIAVLCEGRGTTSVLSRFPARDAGDFGSAPPERVPFALRLFDDRVLRFAGGRVEISDPWSVMRFAVPSAERGVIETLFDLSLADEALPAAAADAGAPTLTVFHRSEKRADELREWLASTAGFAALQPRGTTLAGVAEERGGFSATLVDEAGGAVRKERVEKTADGVRVTTLEGETSVAERVFTFEPDAEGTRLVLHATLARPVPHRGPDESVRKTLVFHLASELLAL